MDDSSQVLSPPLVVTETRVEAASEPFVARWNRLVSTTNWEKGRIITQWRQALVEANARPSEYSDEAWSRRVGGVTSQHAGRLRRVFGRFGEVYEQYQGLFWSHFQAAVEWDDAEMWLEGAVQNRWSVSHMRRMRWEALGAVADLEPKDEDVVTSELDDDADIALEPTPGEQIVAGEYAEARGASVSERDKLAESDEENERSKREPSPDASAINQDPEDRPANPLVRPFENLAELPQDLAEALESFKLAILRHKTEGWRQVSRDDVLASLEALKQLVMAPSAGGVPF